MPRARKQQVSLADTPYYHCVSRCVRRAFLCGYDSVTGKSFEHRKQWIADRLADLSTIFAIDVCAYAIMSNHVHCVLKINEDKARNWNDQEVIHRWKQLFSLPVLIQRFCSGQCHSAAEQEQAQAVIAIWRERLMDISWFMRCLNEPIARRANAEDKCTGRFWEGRFKSQALLNEQAVLACMSYVDLNPVRASVSDSLETSHFTSVKQRIDQLKGQEPEADIALADFIRGSQGKDGIAFSLHDYLELTDWTGRCIRGDKKGHIKSEIPKILHILGMEGQIWLETVQGFSGQFHTFIGPERHLKTICQRQAKNWVQGLKLCRQLFDVQKTCSV